MRTSISIHAPLRERPWFCPDCRCERQFQSTLPRGSDITHSRYTQILPKFQSTLPHGSDSAVFYLLCGIRPISIHAPSQERRCGRTGARTDATNFNPRSLTGATEQHPETSDRTADFNPRSLTGATTLRMRSQYICHISIHAPSRERRRPSTREFVLYIFQSTLPHGSDQPPSYQDFVAYRISIHAPSRERRCTAHRVS